MEIIEENNCFGPVGGGVIIMKNDYVVIIYEYDWINNINKDVFKTSVTYSHKAYAASYGKMMKEKYFTSIDEDFKYL